MTQKELRKHIKAVQRKHISTGIMGEMEETLQMESDLIEDLLLVINHHVAEVIGEDTIEDYGIAKGMGAPARNSLRTEQRKRAGL